MVFWLLPRTPGYVNGPRSVTEKTGGCERPPEAPPKKLDVRGQAISITYTTYYCRLLLIIDYYYLELCIDPVWWKIIIHTKTNHYLWATTTLHNCPQEHIAERLQRWDIELAKKRNTLRQKQYFENSQKYLGRLERASVSKNHNEHF